jgi:hypothetical protein
MRNLIAKISFSSFLKLSVDNNVVKKIASITKLAVAMPFVIVALLNYNILNAQSVEDFETPSTHQYTGQYFEQLGSITYFL